MANQTIAPPSGQTPLANLPQYGGAGGGSQAANYYAAQDFFNTFGRNPTQSELDQLAPGYLSSDPNVANLAGGKANVAAYYNQLSNTPQQIFQQQQSQYTQQAPQFANQVSQVFQQNLGRAPTQDELTHFGSLIASGQDPYQIQQALQQTQEYQNTQNTNFQNQLKGQLQSSNSDYFNKYILPSIQSQNALAGRTQDSSGYQAQLSNAALQQNQGLQNFLAGVSAQNYQGSVANAQNQYQSLMGQQYGLQNAGVSNALSNQASNNQYNQNLNMYQLQQQAYNNYLNQYGKRGSWMQNLGTGLNYANSFVNLFKNSAGPTNTSQGSSGGGGGGFPGSSMGSSSGGSDYAFA